MRESESTQMPPGALWLGYAGLVPFVFGLAALLFGATPAQELVGKRVFVGYSAVILAFLGGVRWGAALSQPQFKPLLLAVGPSLIAFGALLLDPPLALIFLTVSFAVVGAADVLKRTTPQWPHWFALLRMRLSVAVVALHLLMLYLLHARGY